ncbi:MAG: hypothetical protein AB1426_05090 [Bacillota bacterium]
MERYGGSNRERLRAGTARIIVLAAGLFLLSRAVCRQADGALSLGPHGCAIPKQRCGRSIDTLPKLSSVW